jgi:hypothetical protein
MLQIGKFPESSGEERGDVCPFLGLLDDPQTSLSFPAQWNACHRAKPPFSPNLDHQQAYCLTASHVTCPVFNKKSVEALPKEIRALVGTKPARRQFFWPFLLAFLLLAVGIAAGVWMLKKWNSNADHQPTPTASPAIINGTVSLAATETATPSITFTPLLPGVTIVENSSTPTDTATPMPTPTVTPSQTPKPIPPTPRPTATPAPVQHPTGIVTPVASLGP